MEVDEVSSQQKKVKLVKLEPTTPQENGLETDKGWYPYPSTEAID